MNTRSRLRSRSRGAPRAQRRVLERLAVAALVLVLSIPQLLAGQSTSKTASRGFDLFGADLLEFQVNRVSCGVSSDGQVCINPTGSRTMGGGFWPKGTANQYIFNSGLQVAGIIGGDGGPWAGDTTGAFFFDPKGTTRHGSALSPISDFSNPTDRLTWPAEALVPSGSFYHSSVVGTPSASEADLWWLMWDGDPAKNLGRPHPLGVLVESRALGWNQPSGNEDVIYFVHTFYNITSLDEADYAGAAPAMRPILRQRAAEFHAFNNSAFGITVPTNGYTLTRFHVGYSSDADVAQAGVNYSGANVPFAMASTWDYSFSRASWWTFDPAIYSPPFFAGSGFVGSTFLFGPSGAQEAQIISTTPAVGHSGFPEHRPAVAIPLRPHQHGGGRRALQ